MTTPTVVENISELKALTGVPLGTTAWVEISQQQIDAFAEATGDRQWIHVDVERARRESPFGQTIAHGYLTVSLVPVLLARLLVVKNVSNIVNYGFDKLRLQAPVPAGARVRLSAEIKKVREMPTGGAHVTKALRIEVEGAPKPACVADAIYVYFP